MIMTGRWPGQCALARIANIGCGILAAAFNTLALVVGLLVFGAALGRTRCVRDRD
jgi:hypothetical protein